MNNECEFENIMSRLKKAVNAKSNNELAMMLGLSSSGFANLKKRNSVPYDRILEVLKSHNVSMDWLLTGEGEMLKSRVIEKKPIEKPLHEDEQTQRMIRMFTKLGESERQDVFCATERIHKISEIERELRELKNANSEKKQRAA